MRPEERWAKRPKRLPGRRDQLMKRISTKECIHSFFCVTTICVSPKYSFTRSIKTNTIVFFSYLGKSSIWGETLGFFPTFTWNTKTRFEGSSTSISLKKLYMLSRFISSTQNEDWWEFHWWVPCLKETVRLWDLFLKTLITPGGFLALSRPRAELLLVISEDLLQVKNC